MLGIIKVAWGARKYIKPAGGLIVRGIKAIGSNKDKIEPLVASVSDSKDEILDLYISFKSKLDTDGDGKNDLTRKEILEFISEVIFVVVKRL